jgi:hypothetical protein
MRRPPGDAMTLEGLNLETLGTLAGPALPIAAAALGVVSLAVGAAARRRRARRNEEEYRSLVRRAGGRG